MNTSLAQRLWRVWVWPDEAMLYAQARWVLRKFNFAIASCSLGCWGATLMTVDTSETMAYGWNVLYSLVVLLMMARGRYLRLNRDAVAHARQLAAEQVVCMAILSVLVAAYIGWLYGCVDETPLMVHIVVLSAVVAGSLGFSASYLPTFLAFSFPVIASVWLCAMSAWGRSPLVNTLVMTTPIYWAAMTYFGVQYCQMAMDHIRSRLEREQLNQQLSAQVAQTDAARLRAEAAERAQTRFLAATSHDLRQPLQAMVLFMQVLNRQGLTVAQADVLDKVDLSVRTLTTMLNGLLDYTRIHTGAHYHVQPLALQPLLFDLSVEFGGAADHKQLVLRLRDTEAWVHSDKLALQLILRNLLSNAIRYTHCGGVLLGVRRRAGRVVVEVWDTGLGIAPEHLPHIFETYYQVDNPERNVEKGLGLGLSIVHDLAAQIGAQLSVDSRPGRGSVFRCALPEASAMDAGDAQPLAPATAPRQTSGQGAGAVPARTSLQGLHVLVVDDHASVLDSMRMLLESMGAVCHCASNQGQAQSLQRRAPLSLVLSDYRLAHGENGVEVIRTLQQAQPDLRAILFTGDIGLRHDLQARMPNVPILIKPINAHDLHVVLSRPLAARPDDFC